MKKQTETKAILQRKLKEAVASQIHVYHFADLALDKLSTDNLAGSGVILELTVLGGRAGIEPTLIRDGLSKETIKAIQNDLKRSYDLATMFKPRG